MPTFSRRLLRCEPVLSLCQKTVRAVRTGTGSRKKEKEAADDGHDGRLNGVPLYSARKSNGASKETDDKRVHRNVGPEDILY